MDDFQGNTLKKTLGYVCSITEFIGASLYYFGQGWLSPEETSSLSSALKRPHLFLKAQERTLESQLKDSFASNGVCELGNKWILQIREAAVL